MSGKNFMGYGDAESILTEYANDIKSRVSTKANQGLTSQQQANAKTNIGIEKVPNVATNDQTPTFLEESSRVNIASGDKLSLIFGKIKKFFSDLKTVAFTGNYNDLSNKPSIPSQLSDLTDDSSHRTVSDTEKTTWNGKATKKTTMDSYYGTSSTGADTAAKVITVTDGGSNFSLRAGIAITVKFTAQNTAQNPTFNVNNTGAKSVWYNAAVVTTGTLWAGGNTRPARYVYDGTYWVWMGHAIDNNTTYSAMSKAELTTGTSTSSRTVRADYLKAGIEELIDGKIAEKADKSLLEDGNDHFQFGVDENGNYGYHKTVGGADTVIPFKTVGTRSGAITANGTYTAKTDISKDGYESVTVSVSPNLQSKTVAAGTANVTVSPDASYDGLSSVVVQPTPSQTKSASPSTSAQTISPDSGKLLSSVSISAISPQRSNGTAATTTGIDSTGPYVYFPYGWWPEANANGNYTRLTAAQAVAVCPKEEKTVTSSRSAQTVTPSSGKLLSKVTVNALAPTGTYTPTSNSSASDMGATSNYRYVNTNTVYNLGWNLRVEKFWTNSSPNSSFSTMDINLSSGKLTQYQFIFIRFKLTTSLSQYENIIGINTSNFTKYTISVTNIGNISNVMAYAFVEGSYSVWRPIQYTTPSTTRDGIRIERPIVITGNSDGSIKAVYQTNGTHHGYLIPLEAYGVKAAK